MVLPPPRSQVAFAGGLGLLLLSICDLGGGKTITTDYSSPRLKGRKMIGGVEPYGKVWRNGANEATTFVTTTDLMVGGVHVPAGSYTLFVIPNPDKWTLI